MEKLKIEKKFWILLKIIIHYLDIGNNIDE